jgi:hypothetical protein
MQLSNSKQHKKASDPGDNPGIHQRIFGLFFTL